MVNFTTRIETACVISHAKRHNAIGVKLVYLQSSILFQDSAGKTCYQICSNSSVSWKHSNAETVIVYVEILLMKCSNISINIPLYKYFFRPESWQLLLYLPELFKNTHLLFPFQSLNRRQSHSKFGLFPSLFYGCPRPYMILQHLNEK